jgi:murein DD-endopeptidase MepM/ murein hydrolase activator NlpD
VLTATVEVAQGGAAVLEVQGGGVSAVATVQGKPYTLLRKEGGFWAVIGAAANQELGSYPISIVIRDGAGLTVAELSASLVVYDTAYPVEQIFLTASESALLDPALAQQEEATRASVYAKVTPERLWSGPFVYPVAGIISSPYGIGRSYNGAPVSSYHTGADFSADEGVPVAAANSGRVAFAGALPIRGNSVIIDHGAGVFSAYHHLSATSVQQGQMVNKGDLVGYVGSSGLATGPHLHWEIVVNGANVDPVLWTYEEIGP